MKYTTYAENIYRPGETTPPLGTAHSEADAVALAAELNRLASVRDAAVEACRVAKKFFDSVRPGGPVVESDYEVFAALAHVLSATPTPAPTVNAELLEACRRALPACWVLATSGSPDAVAIHNEVRTAIANAEKH